MPYDAPRQPVPPSQPRHVRHAFRARLDEVDGRFVGAARAVADAVVPLSTRAREGDTTAAEEARTLSIETGTTSEALQDDGYRLLALEAPVAADLRRVVALLRVVRNADRAASLLRHGCETVLEDDGGGVAEGVRPALAELSARAGEVFDLGLRSWQDPEGVPADRVAAADDDVDRLHDELLAASQRAQATRRQALTVGLLARYYERLGDHGVAIARDGAFVATGNRPGRSGEGT